MSKLCRFAMIFTIAAAVLSVAQMAGAVTFNEFPIPTAGSYLNGITLGPDGNIWFAEVDGNKIGRITPSGVITEFPVPTADSGPNVITSSPDGNLWFTEL